MPPEITVHGFETSNNIKVRVALGYKQIPYAFNTIDPKDRTEILRLSGQHLTPILVHGDRVIFDSAAILRYLDANFRDRPALFGTSLTEQWAIEDLELFARAVLAAPMLEVVHRRVSGGPVDDAMMSRCSRAFEEAVAVLAVKLGSRTWLVGDAMTAADITAAAVIHRIKRTGLFELPAAGEIDDWVRRVMAFDHRPD